MIEKPLGHDLASSVAIAEHFGGKSFIEKGRATFPVAPIGAMGIKFFDYDNDGRTDLYITDMHGDMLKEQLPPDEKAKIPGGMTGGRQVPAEMRAAFAYLEGGPKVVNGNALYHNLGGGKFAEVSAAMNTETYWPWGLSVADVNADGWLDVFVTGSMNYPFRYGINSMLLNNEGHAFRDSEFLLGIEPRRDGRTRTPWFQTDCGKPDAARPNDPRLPMPCQGHTGMIEVMATIGSRASAIFDLDNDGDLDIVTNDFNSGPQVLISDLSQQRPIHWLGIALNGTTSNREGLGAVVTVVAGNRTLMQVNDGKSGYLSQSDLPLYFGLDAATAVDRIEITWPTGRRQIIRTGIELNKVMKITEGS